MLRKSGKWEAAIKKFSDDKAAGVLAEMKEMIPGIEENPPVELNQPGKMWIGPTENRRGSGLRNTLQFYKLDADWSVLDKRLP